MGNKYIKPLIRLENLNMSSNVSSGCSQAPTAPEYSCPVMIPEWGETIFTQNTDCFWDTPDMYDTVCYHVPFGDGNVFTS